MVGARALARTRSHSSGPDSNGSQFFITFEKTPWLDGKHVVFGRVLDGMATMRKIEAANTGRMDRPVEEIKVVASGLLDDATAGKDASADTAAAQAASETKATGA